MVEQYQECAFIRKFHEHVSESRLSNIERVNLLRALVISVRGISPHWIVRCYLNNRGREPLADNSDLRIVLRYPEPGVLRTFRGTNTKSWSDQVVTPSDFRRPA